MNEAELAAEYTGPRTKRRVGSIWFHWSRRGRSPTHRYRLEYDVAARSFGLTKYHRTSSKRTEHRSVITDPAIIAVFRRALLPAQIALITRLSMEARR